MAVVTLQVIVERILDAGLPSMSEWRKESAAEWQYEFASELGLSIPKNATKGEVADLIFMAMDRKIGHIPWERAKEILIKTNPHRSATDTVVHFMCSSLEDGIRGHLGKPKDPITHEDLALLAGLLLKKKRITDLSGLEYGVGLTKLNLDSNKIIDISPLAGMTNLTGLTLSRNRITDVSPLLGITGLNELDLDDNKIVDVSPLSGMNGLNELDLSRNKITDITPLLRMNNLSWLGLYNNKIPDDQRRLLSQALPYCNIDFSGDE